MGYQEELIKNLREIKEEKIDYFNVENDIEKGYIIVKYEKLLLESIKRKPTEHTVWMLNRILNDVNLEERNVYMDVLKAIVKDSKYDEELRSLAKEFLEYQEG